MKNTGLKEKPLLQNAFEIWFRELGPRKTIQLWQILTLQKEDYLTIRHKIFRKKSLKQLYQEAKKFNK